MIKILKYLQKNNICSAKRIFALLGIGQTEKINIAVITSKVPVSEQSIVFLIVMIEI